MCLGLVPHSPQLLDGDENPEQMFSDNKEVGELSKGREGLLNNLNWLILAQLILVDTG